MLIASFFTFLLAVHAAPREIKLTPLAIHVCAAYLSRPDVERVHLEGESLAALNDTFARLGAGDASAEAQPLLKLLERTSPLLPESDQTQLRVRQHHLLPPSDRPGANLGAEDWTAVSARIGALYADVTKLGVDQVTFGHVARGADAFFLNHRDVEAYLERARDEQQPILDRRAGHFDRWTVGRHVWNLPMAVVILPMGLWKTGAGAWNGIYDQDFTNGILMTTVGVAWLATQGREAFSYARGYLTERWRTAHRNRYDQHRTAWTPLFAARAYLATIDFKGDQPIFGFAAEGAIISVKTMEALLALSAGETLPVEAVVETLRHGHRPFKHIPEPDRRYLFLDRIYYDPRDGSLPVLLTFVRFKKPGVAIEPPRPKRDATPAPASAWDGVGQPGGI